MKELKRRAFLKASLIAGISGNLASGKAPFESKTLVKTNSEGRKWTNTPKKIIVAGAGISGLSCAYELMKNGHDVIILEASGRYGGHVYTCKEGLSDGLYAEYGANHVTKPGYEQFFKYAEEFGLELLPYHSADHVLKMIDNKFYDEKMLQDAGTLKTLGFNNKEIEFLKNHQLWELQTFYLQPYIDRIIDVYNPFIPGMDELDNVMTRDIYLKEGASDATVKLYGSQTSALYTIWRLAVKKSRGIDYSGPSGALYRLKGGNSELIKAFGRQLGDRIWIGCKISMIEHTDQNVTVTYTEFGREEEMKLTADYLVNCISLPIFRDIIVEPPLSTEKQFVVDNLSYSSHPYYIFEARSKFWLDDGLKSINMEFQHPDIFSIWQCADEVKTNRVVLMANGPGGLHPNRVLAAFRSLYPGKKDSIYQAMTKDWSNTNSPTCEMEPFPLGEMKKFWPEVIKPNKRIYFGGTYADILSRGMESCLRSGNRIAKEVDQLTS